MKHSIIKNSMLTSAIAATLAWSTLAALPLAAQATSGDTAAPAEKTAVKPTPRAADGHPDLSGVWWRGADVGGRPPGGQRPPGPPAQRPVFFSGLYTPAAQAHAKTLGDKDDPTLHCTSTAFGTLNVSMFDVGAVAQIVQSPKFVVMLTETLNGFQIIPFDGRPHRDNVPPSNRGDAIGRWDGDTFVVDKTNFTDDTWISAEGRVSYHSDALHIIERYRRPDFNTLEIEATLEDPKVLTQPWVVPKQTLVLAPFDQIMELPCTSSDTEKQKDAAAPPSYGKK
jgi:hypothetical protein